MSSGKDTSLTGSVERMASRKISRGKFLGLGLSAAVIYTGTSPFIARAQTVNFGAATTGRLSSYCRGDGSDETKAINRCFAEHLYVEVDEPPAGIGYGFSMQDIDSGLILRSGHEINGLGAESKFLRVGSWIRNEKGFVNDDKINGNSSIKLNNIYLEGNNGRGDVPDLDSNADTTGIAIRTRRDDTWCSDISFDNVEVHNWPGVCMRIRNGSNVVYTDVLSADPTRGGVIFNTSKNVYLKRVKSYGCSDDAIAFNTAGVDAQKASTYRPMYGIEMDECEAQTKHDPEYGAAVKFGGAREALVKNSTFGPSKNSAIVLNEFPGDFNPRDIVVQDCTIEGGQRHSYQILASSAQGIVVANNYMKSPNEDCINVSSSGGVASSFDVDISNNILVDPGSGRYIGVQSNVSGVQSSYNRFVKSDDRPIIESPSPKPNSRSRDLTPTIKATVRDSVTDLSKDDINLYVAGKRVTKFGYNRTSNVLTYIAPKMSRGKKSVRIVAKDRGGQVASKSWSFTLV